MKALTIFLVMIAVPAAFGLYWLIKPRLVKKRRRRVRERPPPEGLEEVLSRNVGLYSLLPDDLREELHGHVNVFLNEKRFLG
ncbi:MAG: zinc-dependent peptidase, partial [Woeseiaceae bacterium]